MAACCSSERGRAGERSAFEELVRHFQAPLYHFLRMRVGSDEDALELAQDSFLAAWRQRERYDPARSFGTWLFTVAERKAISHLRRARHQREQSADESAVFGADGGPGPARTTAARDELSNLWRLAKRELSANQLAALWLHHADGRPIAEVAEILGRAPATVRVILFRARKRLLAALSASADSARRPSSLGLYFSAP